MNTCDPIVNFLSRWPMGGPFLFVFVVIGLPVIILGLKMWWDDQP